MTYTEAIEIRMRAAQRQYVSADELAEAHKVVAYTRQRNRPAEPETILVHPSEPLPFLPEVQAAAPVPFEPAPPDPKEAFTRLHIEVAVGGHTGEEPLVKVVIPELSRCQQRCAHLGLCQGWKPCDLGRKYGTVF